MSIPPSFRSPYIAILPSGFCCAPSLSRPIHSHLHALFIPTHHSTSFSLQISSSSKLHSGPCFIPSTSSPNRKIVRPPRSRPTSKCTRSLPPPGRAVHCRHLGHLRCAHVTLASNPLSLVPAVSHLPQPTLAFSLCCASSFSAAVPVSLNHTSLKPNS